METNAINILIVEDDTDNVMLYRNMFRHSDFNAICIHSDDLTRLSNIVAQTKPATILFDSFSICSQCDLVDELVESLSDIPTAVITTSPNSRCNSRFDYMIAKPFIAEDLYATLAWLIS